MNNVIAFFAAEPSDQAKVQLDREFGLIKDCLSGSKLATSFHLEICYETRIKDLRRKLLDDRPQFVHFSGHGDGKNGLAFVNDDKTANFVSNKSLADLFGLLPFKIECVVLNACHSEVQGNAIIQHVPRVVGMRQAIGDNAAIDFSTGYYDALFRGEPPDRAFNFGCNAITLDRLPDAVRSAIDQRNVVPIKPLLEALPEELKPILLRGTTPLEDVGKALDVVVKLAATAAHSAIEQSATEIGDIRTSTTDLRNLKVMHDQLHNTRIGFFHTIPQQSELLATSPHGVFPTLNDLVGDLKEYLETMNSLRDNTIWRSKPTWIDDIEKAIASFAKAVAAPKLIKTDLIQPGDRVAPTIFQQSSNISSRIRDEARSLHLDKLARVIDRVVSSLPLDHDHIDDRRALITGFMSVELVGDDLERHVALHDECQTIDGELRRFDRSSNLEGDLDKARPELEPALEELCVKMDVVWVKEFAVKRDALLTELPQVLSSVAPTNPDDRLRPCFRDFRRCFDRGFFGVDKKLLKRCDSLVKAIEKLNDLP